MNSCTRGIFVAFIALALVRPVLTRSNDQAAGCADAGWPVLPTESAIHTEAMDFSKTLADHGVIVQCIAPSKMASTFDGMAGAALYKTYEGSFEVLFLPAPRNFDELQIIEQRERERYIYSFGGQPRPWPANRIDAARPVFFIKNLNRLIVAHDKQLAARLESFLPRR
jgi:hypothetical protein